VDFALALGIVGGLFVARLVPAETACSRKEQAGTEGGAGV
jgi:hypothetical protein